MAKRASTPRGAKAVQPDDREIPHSFIMASLLPGEPAESKQNNNTGRDFEMVCRGVAGTVYRAATINSTCLASQTLRLFRRGGRQNKRYQTRAVTDRKTLRYLCGDGPVRPTVCKGANYAAKSGDNIEEVLVHPILDVLQNPDPVYSGQVWMQAIWFQREVAGRAYLWGGERTNGIPTSLYILPSAYTWPVTSTTGLIEGFVYARNRTSMMRCDAADVVYLRHQANPFNPAGAMSWLNSVTGESDMENAAIRAEVARWNNGGMPGMVLKASPTTTDPQMGQMQAALSRAVQGVGKAGSMLLLRDTELVQYATKPHEMQYTAGMEATEKRIYDAAGVPESIYRLNSANLASAQVSDTQYAKHTLAPRLAVMASELTELLLPMFGVEPGEMWFMFDNPVRDDIIQLAAEYRAAELQGVITPNEYRRLLDLEALPDEQNALRYRQTEAPAPQMPMFGGPTGGTAEPGPASVDEDVAENEGDTEETVDPEDAEDTDVKALRTKAESHTPTDTMAEEAQRGLDWRQEFGRGGTEIGVARARDIANKRGLSLDTVYRMASYFARHEVDKQGQGWSPDQDGYPSAGRIAWALWGGDPGRAWADQIVKSAEAEDEETKANEPEGKAVANGSDSGACKCGACGTRGTKAGTAGDAADPATAGGNSTHGATVHGPVKLKGFIDEWDEAAQVPKSTAKLFGQFQNAMNAWYASTMPAMVNDQLFVEYPSPEAMRKFTQITDTFIGKVLENGAAVGIAKLPGATEGTWNIASESAMQYVRDRSFELAKSVPETMKGTVQAVVEKELANPEGFTVDTVKIKIQEQVPELSGYQAERLARTETAAAFGEGQVQAWKAEGIKGKQWLIGGGPCPTCEAVAAKYPNPIPIDDMFEYGGESRNSIPWHPNCQCAVSPSNDLPETPNEPE